MAQPSSVGLITSYAAETELVINAKNACVARCAFIGVGATYLCKDVSDQGLSLSLSCSAACVANPGLCQC